MKWAFGIRRKISAALLLAAIFVLVLVKNVVDGEHVAQLGSSFSSVYEDRLMVESYIFRISEHLFRKKILMDTSNSIAAAERIRPQVDGHSAAISHIITQYEKTKLTEAETRFFSDFKENIRQLTALEDSYFHSLSVGDDPHEVRNNINSEFNKASTNLGHLSGIQISEGRILNEHSKKIVAGSSLLTQFELGILIAIGLMIMVLVFESSSIFRESAFDKSARKQTLN